MMLLKYMELALGKFEKMVKERKAQVRKEHTVKSRTVAFLV